MRKILAILVLTVIALPAAASDFGRQRLGINGGAIIIPPMPPVWSFPIILGPGDTPIGGDGQGGPPPGGGWTPPSQPPRDGDIPA